MSDIRIQNLLQSMQTTPFLKQGAFDLSNPFLVATAGDLPDDLQTLLTSVSNAPSKAQLTEQNQLVLPFRITDIQSNGDITLNSKGQELNLPIASLPNVSKDAQGLKIGDQVVLVVDQKTNTDLTQQTALFTKVNKVSKSSPAETNQAVSLQKNGELDTPPIENPKYAERVEKLKDIEGKIDQILAKLPSGRTEQTVTLKTIAVDLNTQSNIIKTVEVQRSEIDIVGVKSNTTIVSNGQTIVVESAGSINAAQSSIAQFGLTSNQSLFPVNNPNKNTGDKQSALITDKTIFLGQEKTQGVDSVAASDNDFIVKPDIEVLNTVAVSSNAKPITESNLVLHSPREQQVALPAQATTKSPEFIVTQKPEAQQSPVYRAANAFSSNIVLPDQNYFDSYGLLNNQASKITVRVVGETHNGDKVIQPDLPNWPQNKALILSARYDNDHDVINAIKTGDILYVFIPVSDKAFSLNLSAPVERPATTAPQNLLIPDSIKPLWSAMPFMMDLQAVLTGSVEEMLLANTQLAVQTQQHMMIPSLAKPQEIPAALLFLVAAMRSGDVGQLFGERANDMLLRLGKADALNEFLRSGQDPLKTAIDKGSTMGEWRSVLLPMISDTQISPIALHWNDGAGGQSHEEEDGGAHDIKRFVMDFTLSKMGDVQLDGFYDTQSLNVALRLEELPSDTMQERMRGLYLRALDQLGLAGDIQFQHYRDNLITFKLAET